MGESRLHQDLVNHTHSYIARRFVDHPAFVTFVDGPSTQRGEKPPQIGGFVPDILGMDVPTTLHVIGEAKTLEDLERKHTTVQLLSFLRHLRTRGGLLIVTVPWVAAARARHLVARAIHLAEATHVESVILDDRRPCP